MYLITTIPEPPDPVEPPTELVAPPPPPPVFAVPPPATLNGAGPLEQDPFPPPPVCWSFHVYFSNISNF